MRNPEASRQECEGELQRVEIHVSLGRLEPLDARLSRTLQRLHRRAAP